MHRVGAHDSPLRFVGRILFIIFCLALIWYGLMVLLLALGILTANQVDLISGLYTAYNLVSGVTASAFSGTARLTAGLAGLAAFLVFLYLAVKEVPRPYLARHRLELGEDDRGTVAVEPRAVERAAEGAAYENALVSSASGHYTDDQLGVDVQITRPREVPDALRDVHRRVTEALGRHDLPPMPVSVTLTGFDPEQPRREIT